MTKTVCISGYYGFDNFGDETILKILVENLKSFEKPPKITVFSSNPDKTALQFEVDSVQSFNIKSLIKTIMKSDCLISGGGSLLQDATSAKSLVYYLGVIGIAAFFRKKIIIFAQGIGPVNNRLLANLTVYLIKKADLVTVRDDNSLRLMEKSNIKAIKCSDPVWNYNITKNTACIAEKIGIQLRDFASLEDKFIKQLASSINKFYQDKEINLLSLQNNIDLDICNKLKKALIEINPALKIKVIENTSNDKVIEDICSLNTLIAMRYHACLIAIKARVKLLPLSYDIKTETLAKEFNLEYIDVSKFDDMEEIFEKFVSRDIHYDNEKIDSLKFDFKLLENVM